MDVTGKMTHHRIEYIDLMKGFCIVSIVALHFKIFPEYSLLNNMSTTISIPLYFFLSGIFFKVSNGFIDLFVKKLNKLIIPLLFFSFFFLVIGYAIHFLSNGLLFPHISISKFLFNNYPLWFLKALFISNLIYYFIVRYISNDIIKTIICIFLAYLGIYLSKNPIKIIDLIDKQTCILNAIIGIIFMHAGMMSQKYNILKQQLSIKKQYLLTATTLIILIIFSKGYTDFFQRKYNINFLYFLTASMSGIFLILFVSKKLAHLFLFSFLGRYSLIVLGTHLIFQNIFSPLLHHFILNEQISNWISFIITISLLYTIGIKSIIKLFPQFSAQKDLFTYKH